MGLINVNTSLNQWWLYGVTKENIGVHFLTLWFYYSFLNLNPLFIHVLDTVNSEGRINELKKRKNKKKIKHDTNPYLILTPAGGWLSMWNLLNFA